MDGTITGGPVNDAEILAFALAQETIKRVKAEQEVDSLKVEIQRLQRAANVTVLHAIEDDNGGA